ncbi:hypothetical protein E2P81_ATG11398 [Venturia nashicola]|uniref:Uncharacterized protein n=1 Tax=Venturia nashicola TaxID=86259 RepID=A0A4Z1P141_9PEZI|nr:hypothetical protein E6O75_ATG11087 [Venturia nashicola]TLD35279.1 hypothetical protein E2P81_ATG11398 [Venturia nashicola]
MFLQRELQGSLRTVCKTILKIDKEEKVGRKQHLRYYICLVEFRKEQRLYCAALTRHIEFLHEQDKILEDTAMQRPHPNRSESPVEAPSPADTDAAMPALGSSAAAAGPSGTTHREEVEDAGETGDTYEGDAGLDEGDLSLSRCQSRADPGPSSNPVMGELDLVAECQDSSSSSDEDTYEDVVAFVEEFKKKYDDDAINALMSGEDDKDLKREYEEAATAAIEEGCDEKWPEVMKIRRAFERNSVVFAMVELKDLILRKVDPRPALSAITNAQA